MMLTAFLLQIVPARLAKTALAASVSLALTYTPMSAQAKELDVPYVPTPHAGAARMLVMAHVTTTDFLIDRGSGDGRVANAPVRDRAAKGALGVDIDPERIQEAEAYAKEAGVSHKVRVRKQGLFETDLSQ